MLYKYNSSFITDLTFLKLNQMFNDIKVNG